MIEKNPLVSIALCTYNGSVFLREQLDSILNQTYTNLEIIISDDASKDDTLSLLGSYADSRIKILDNKTNIGLELNFFRAIEACTGAYISVADQDDIWLPEKIEELLALMPGHTLVYADSAFVDAAGRPDGRKLSDLRRMYSGGDNRVFSLCFITCLYGHALMFDASLKGALSSHPHICHDGWIAFIASTYGRIHYYDKVLVLYRQHNNSVTRQSAAVEVNQYEYFSTWFTWLQNHAGERNQEFFNSLNLLFSRTDSLKGRISFSLFMARHANALFYTKPGIFSRLNLIRKMISKRKGRKPRKAIR